LDIEIAKRDKEARDWIGALIVLFFVIGGGAGFVFVVEPIMKIEPASRQLGRSNLSKEEKRRRGNRDRPPPNPCFARD
jgi:hypothetical protein